MLLWKPLGDCGVRTPSAPLNHEWYLGPFSSAVRNHRSPESVQSNFELQGPRQLCSYGYCHASTAERGLHRPHTHTPTCLPVCLPSESLAFDYIQYDSFHTLWLNVRRIIPTSRLLVSHSLTVPKTLPWISKIGIIWMMSISKVPVLPEQCNRKGG